MGNNDNIANLSALYHQLQELSAIHKTIDRALHDLPITRFDRYKAIEEAATACSIFAQHWPKTWRVKCSTTLPTASTLKHAFIAHPALPSLNCINVSNNVSVLVMFANIVFPLK